MVRPYKVPGYPVIPLLALAGGLFILVATFLTQPSLAFTGLGLTAIGLPLYYWHQYMQKRTH
jgi:APA family basic amino acid/polyamine antiporter